MSPASLHHSRGHLRRDTFAHHICETSKATRRHSREASRKATSGTAHHLLHHLLHTLHTAHLIDHVHYVSHATHALEHLWIEVLAYLLKHLLRVLLHLVLELLWVLATAHFTDVSNHFFECLMLFQQKLYFFWCSA